MNQWWQIWGAYFSPDDCKKIIDVGLQRSASEGTIGHGANKSKVDDNFRRSKIRWLDRRDEDVQWIMRRIEHAFQFANSNAFQFDLTYFKDVQFTEYNADSEGKYDWHEDLTWAQKSPTRRKLSFCCQLSSPEDYSGGELEVDEHTVGGKDMLPNAAELKKQGTVLIFPSFLRHRVLPVTQGIRYSLVSWYEGPTFR